MSDPAAARFWTIQLVRLSGVALVVVGLLLQAGRIAPLREIPQAGALILIAIGLVEIFVAPTLLARRWRSPRE
jgi:hypothetical protein